MYSEVEQDFRTTFLVLEDDANDAIMMRRAFTNAACRAFVCRNTSEARAYFAGAGMYENRSRFPAPDIFITDLRLGDESGFTFVEWLRTRNEFKNIPVIVIAGSVGPKEIARAKSLGVSRIVQKPANPIDLEFMVLKLSREFSPKSSRREPLQEGHSV